VKAAAEIFLVIHLFLTLPIIINPTNQFFEKFLGIPASQSNNLYTFITFIVQI
jgi:hypothetical protein